MRKIMWFPICVLMVSLSSQAQTTPQEKDAPKSDKPQARETAPKPDKAVDLDAFFKRGEESAKQGGSCRKPEKPAEPVA